jgi:uncharacterized damage-inducible protein DinB
MTIEGAMTVNDLERTFDYNYWASRKLLEVVCHLTDDQFTQAIAGSYGSIRNTMVHILSAEWGWLDRCGGTPRGPALEPSDYPTAASLIDRLNLVEGYVREFLASLQDEDLYRIVEFKLGSGLKYAMPCGALLQHAAIHGVHHRGQISLLLRSLGHVPGNFDYLFYFADQHIAK